MEPEQAREIVARCIAHVYYREGVIDEPPPSIAEYSLGELIEANHLISGDAGRKKNEDGSETISMHCDDRLVAALYTLHNYEACDQDDIDPIVSIDGKVLCCVRVPTNAEADKRGDPENPCSLYRDGTPSPDASCMGDGHYMCAQCEQKYEESDGSL